MNQLIDSNNMIAEIENTHKMCEALMRTPHYQKMGAEGIFAIVEKAKSIGLNPLDALNGGLYFTKGKVEMTSQTMNFLIREKKHSILLEKLDEKECILKGKRADNGDMWIASFSYSEAEKAGITICKSRDGRTMDGPWQKYPKDMLYARALSRLARQLFPDVIKGCYVQGEISDAPALNAPVQTEIDISFEKFTPKSEEIEKIDNEQYVLLSQLIENNPVLKNNILNFMKKRWGLEDLKEMPLEIYNSALKRAKDQFQPSEEEVKMLEVINEN